MSVLISSSSYLETCLTVGRFKGQSGAGDRNLVAQGHFRDKDIPENWTLRNLQVSNCFKSLVSTMLSCFSLCSHGLSPDFLKEGEVLKICLPTLLCQRSGLEVLNNLLLSGGCFRAKPYARGGANTRPLGKQGSPPPKDIRLLSKMPNSEACRARFLFIFTCI